MFTRYQFQPWYVKLYRRLRWCPYCMLRAVLQIAYWWLTGGKISIEERGWFLNRWQFAKFLWRLRMSDAHMKMKFYWTLDEVMEQCKTRG